MNMMWFAGCVMWFAGSIGPVWCGVHLGRMFVEWTLLNPCSIYSTNIPPHQHNATQGHRFCYMQAARRIFFSARVLQHIIAWGREGSAGQRAASLASQHTACTALRSHAPCTVHNPQQPFSPCYMGGGSSTAGHMYRYKLHSRSSRQHICWLRVGTHAVAVPHCA